MSDECRHGHDPDECMFCGQVRQLAALRSRLTEAEGLLQRLDDWGQGKAPLPLSLFTETRAFLSHSTSSPQPEERFDPATVEACAKEVEKALGMSMATDPPDIWLRIVRDRIRALASPTSEGGNAGICDFCGNEGETRSIPGQRGIAGLVACASCSEPSPEGGSR